MRIFVAGATGVIGRPLVAALLGAGHEVAALARTAEKARALEAQGAEAVLARKRQLPIVGSGEGRSSFVHVDDAAAATLLALDHGRPASTTSPTTSPRRPGTGSPRSRGWPAPSRRATCPPGWCAWWRARRWRC